MQSVGISPRILRFLLTGLGGERAPAAVAVAEDEVAELLVLLRRPQALPVLRLGLLARLAPHCLLGWQRRNAAAEDECSGAGRREEEGAPGTGAAGGFGGALALWCRSALAWEQRASWAQDFIGQETNHEFVTHLIADLLKRLGTFFLVRAVARPIKTLRDNKPAFSETMISIQR